MGYSWRKTSGKILCRPKQYNSPKYPPSNRICNKNCPFYIFCKLETMHTTLGERIDEIRLILQRPFHIFTYLPKEDQIMFILESEDINKVQRLSFTGRSIIRAIESAEAYIEREKITGGLGKIEEVEETTDGTTEEIKQEQQPENNPEDNQE